MVSAEVLSDDNVAITKREAPMAEPSTEYLPPRLEAPYATYQPILAGNPHQTSFYQNAYSQQQQNGYSQQQQNAYSQQQQQNAYNQQQNAYNQAAVVSTAATPYEYNRYTGVVPLSAVDNNDLGNGLNPGPPYGNGYNELSSGYGQSNSYSGGPNSYGNYGRYSQNAPYNGVGQSTQINSYGQSNQVNGLGQSLNVYGGSGYTSNAGNFDQYSTIKGSFGNSAANVDNSYYGNPSFGSVENRYPSSAALVSNEPVYGTVPKGLHHYPQGPQQVSHLNTQTLKNSRPVALQAAHLVRKPPPFLGDAKNPNFRPSFLLGSSVLTSTPDYNQPSLTSLGTTAQYLAPTQSIPQEYVPQSIGNLPLAQREYLPPQQPNFISSYQNPGNLVQSPPGASYGLPETIIYTKSSLYGEQYGPSQ